MLAVIFAGGDEVPDDVGRALPRADVVIAADSGAAVARRLGFELGHLIGDLDSIDAESLAWVRQHDATVHEHPPDKDATDLELAFDLATTLGTTGIILVGGHGGRIDHLAANLALVADRRWPNPVTWLAGADRIEVVRGDREISANPGATVTVLAAEPSDGVSLRGLAWPLEDVALDPGSTRGVSNLVSVSPFGVSVARGTLVVILPAPE